MICIPIDTRPTIIKISPIARELENKNVDFFISHTGQHYSYELDKIFFEELKIPKPKYNLKIGSCSQAEQVGKALIGLEKIFMKERPDVVLIHGDANMVPSASLAAYKLSIKSVHKEAGLRSYNRKIGNWSLTILTNLFCPTKIRDTECGFRAFTYKAAKKFKLKAKRYEREVDFIYEVWKNKFKVSYVEIKVPKFYPKPAILRGLKNFKYLLKRRFRIWFVYLLIQDQP